MFVKEYHFITHWHVRGAVQEVTAIISDRTALTHWWPSVYLNAEVVEAGDATGIGTVMRLDTKGWLPYTLRWQFRVSEISKKGFTLIASGDFEGRGIWTFQQNGEWVNIIYDWKVRAEKPLLRTFSFLLRPLFAANHSWAMERGEESLKLELVRRRAVDETERALVPIPPQPTSAPRFFLVTVGSLIVVSGLGYFSAKFLGRR